MRNKTFFKNKINRLLVILAIAVPLLFIFMYTAWGADVMIINSQSGVLNDSITYEHYIESSTADSSGLVCTSCYGITDTILVSSNRFHSYFLYYWYNGSVHKWTDEFFSQPTDTTGLLTNSTMPIRAYWGDSAISARHRLWTWSDGLITGYSETTPSTDSNYQYIMNIPVVNTSNYYLSIDINFPGLDSSMGWNWSRGVVTLGGSVPVPSDTSLCNVYGYVQDRGVGLYRAEISLILPNHAYDSCNSTILIKKVFQDNTDGDGFFSLNVPKSSCLNRNRQDNSLMKYSVEIRYEGEKTKIHEFSIPADSSTYYLVF